MGGPEGASASLNPRYTFRNFIVGSANRLAHALLEGGAVAAVEAGITLLAPGLQRAGRQQCMGGFQPGGENGDVLFYDTLLIATGATGMTGPVTVAGETYTPTADMPALGMNPIAFVAALLG